MKFGQVEDVSQIDFSLPQSSFFTKSDSSHATKSPHVFIGCTSWGAKEWVGSVYPSGTKAKDFLKVYGKQFNSVELNTSFYRIPGKETIEKWIDSTPDDFKFCPKVPRMISHRKNLQITDSILEEFKHCLDQFGKKLGTSFMQLPPYFGPDKAPYLLTLLDKLKGYSIAVELRHEDWYRTSKPLDELKEMLTTNHHNLVITDVAGRRDMVHMQCHADGILIRFVGTGEDDLDRKRLESWVEQLLVWIENGLSQIYFCMHLADNTNSPALCAYIAKVLNQSSDSKKWDLTTRGPKLIEENQMKLF